MTVKEAAEKLSQRLTYLLEPIGLVEADEERPDLPVALSLLQAGADLVAYRLRRVGVGVGRRLPLARRALHLGGDAAHVGVEGL